MKDTMGKSITNNDLHHCNLAYTPLSLQNNEKEMLRLAGSSNYIQRMKPAIKQCRNFCSTCVLVVCIVLLITSLLAVAFKPFQRVVHVVLIEVTEQPVIGRTNSKFLSIGLDTSNIADGFRNFDMKNPKLLKLMSALSPGYLRVGGTSSDRLLFVRGKSPKFKSSYLTELDGGACSYEEVGCNMFVRPNFTMSGEEWLNLNKLANRTGFTILFDLNALMRHDNGTWNSKNSEELISFSNEHNLTVIWELGNEPNSFRHVFNYSVNATQLGRDFKILRTILNKYDRYKTALLVGPDTTRPQPPRNASAIYLRKFLASAGNTVDAITWHQYYFNGRTASFYNFLDPNVFNLLESQIEDVKAIVKELGLQNKPLWLGETASAYGGGAPGYSNRYIGSFIWLDKLGLSAKFGLDVVVRQSIFKGHYALIDEKYEPNPDWWLSVLFKSFVGPEVVQCFSTLPQSVRLYCQCTNKDALYSYIPSITVYGMNLKDAEAKIRIEGLLPIPRNDIPEKVLAYILTARMTLLSKYILLNGETLYLQPNGDLPPFKPRVVNSKPYLTMPPYSMAFWVIESPLLKFCQR